MGKKIAVASLNTARPDAPPAHETRSSNTHRQLRKHGNAQPSRCQGKAYALITLSSLRRQPSFREAASRETADRSYATNKWQYLELPCSPLVLWATRKGDDPTPTPCLYLTIVLRLYFIISASPARRSGPVTRLLSGASLVGPPVGRPLAPLQKWPATDH